MSSESEVKETKESQNSSKVCETVRSILNESKELLTCEVIHKFDFFNVFKEFTFPILRLTLSLNADSKTALYNSTTLVLSSSDLNPDDLNTCLTELFEQGSDQFHTILVIL